jgi:hypothetical protein
MASGSFDQYKPIVEFMVVVLIVGFSVLRKSKVNGRRERSEPSAVRFWLYLIAALICGGIAWFSVQYIRDHHGDYANFLMIFGALFGAPFGAGFLLGALLEGGRVVFRR